MPHENDRPASVGRRPRRSAATDVLVGSGVIDLYTSTNVADMFSLAKAASRLTASDAFSLQKAAGGLLGPKTSEVFSLQKAAGGLLGLKASEPFSLQKAAGGLLGPRPAFPKALSIAGDVTDWLKQERFARLVEPPVFPRADWSAFVADVAANVVDGSAVADFNSELHGVEGQGSDASPDAPWLARLSFAKQFALFVAALELLSEINGLVAEAADVGIPPELRAATQVLLALAALLLLLMDAQSESSQD